jgi:hypothetical protein
MSLSHTCNEVSISLHLSYIYIRHLQHDTRIVSCRIVGRIDENYDMSYIISRIVNSFCDTKRMSYSNFVYSRTFSFFAPPLKKTGEVQSNLRS